MKLKLNFKIVHVLSLKSETVNKNYLSTKGEEWKFLKA